MEKIYFGLLAAALCAACGGVEATPKQTSSAQKESVSPVTATSETTVVARIGSTEITLAEVDKSSAKEVQQLKRSYDKKLSEIRRQYLSLLIQTKVLELEVKKRGLASLDALLKVEVSDKITQPTAEEIKAFYDFLKTQREVPPFESVKDSIKEHLVSQANEERMAQFLEQLTLAYEVEDRLEPYRVAVGGQGPSKGPSDAKVTIVEYADFECPYCSRASRMVLALQKKYSSDVRVVFRHFPLSFHPNAMPAAIATRCAQQQGKFWEMHDKMFEHGAKLSATVIESSAKELGLNGEKFASCQKDPAQQAAVEAEMEAGSAFGVEGTPAFFVNGIPLGNGELEELVNQELKGSEARSKSSQSPKVESSPKAEPAPKAESAPKTEGTSAESNQPSSN